jgi:DNA-directed RNA polymerase alpha subunit
MPSRRDTTRPNEAAFPVGLSGAALRALAHAGIGSMAQLSRRSEAELRALHGMGPKAVRILKSALAQQGRRLHESKRPQRRSG